MGKNNIVDSLAFDVLVRENGFDKKLQAMEEVAKKFNITVSQALEIMGKVPPGEPFGGKPQKAIEGLKRQLADLEKRWGSLNAAQRKGSEGQAIVGQYRQLKSEAGQYGGTLNATVKSIDKAAASSDKLKASQNDIIRSVRKANNDFTLQGRAVSNLNTLFTTYVSIFAVERLVSNIARVRGEFELQQVALRAIIQDAQAADTIFSQIKGLAIESPFQFKELTGYVKQLAAFSIETDKLFDTTSRLADISAGLGVDMGRIILAYGQVRSASVLRGQELRQFTEAGIPLVDQLAKKFGELEGRVVSAGEVFEKISNRQVSFGMVDDIFSDLTSEGGMFFEMQAKQAETLAGKLSNLKDAYEIMLNEIGKDGEGFLKGSVDGMRELMENWEAVATVMGSVAVGLVAYKLATINATIATNALTLAEARKAAMETASVARVPRLIKLILGRNTAMSLAIVLDNAKVASQARLAASTNIVTKAFWKLTAAMLSNPYTLIIAALASLVTYFVLAKSEATKMQEAISDAHNTVNNNTSELVDSMGVYVDRLSKATKGSEEYRNIMREISNQYGEYLPKQLLEAQNLTLLATNTDLLTEAILRKKKAEAIQKGEEAAKDMYGGDLQSEVKNIADELKHSMKPEDANKIAVAYVDAIKSAMEKGEEIDVKKTLAGVISKEFAVSIDEAEKQVSNLVQVSKEEAGIITKLGRYVIAGVTGGAQAASRLTENLEDARDVAKNYTDMLALNKVQADALFSSLNIPQREQYNQRKKELDDLAKLEADALKNNQTIAYKSKLDEEEAKLRIQTEYAQKRFELASKEIIDLQNSIKSEEGLPNPDTAKIEQLKKLLTEAQTIYGLMAEEAKIAYDKLIPTKLSEGIAELVKDFATLKGLNVDLFSTLIKNDAEEDKAYFERIQSMLSETESKIKQLQSAKIQLGVLFNENALIDELNRKELLGIIEKTLGLSSKKETKSSSKDPVAEKLKNQIDLLKKAEGQFEKYLKIASKGDAIKNVLGDAQFKSLGVDFKDYSPADTRKYLEQIYNSIKGNPRFKAIQEQIEKIFTDLDYDKAKKTVDDFLSAIQSEIETYKSDFDFYKTVLGITGDKELSANIAFNATGTDVGLGLVETLKKKLQEATKGEFSFDDLLTFSPEKLKELPDGIQKMFEETKKVIEKSTQDSYLSLVKLVEMDVPEGSGLRFELSGVLAKMNTDIRKAQGELQQALSVSAGADDAMTQTAIRNTNLRIKATQKEAEERARKLGAAFIQNEMDVAGLGNAFKEMSSASIGSLKKMQKVLNDIIKTEIKSFDISGALAGAGFDEAKIEAYKGLFTDLFNFENISEYIEKVEELSQELDGMASGAITQPFVKPEDIAGLKTITTTLKGVGVSSKNTKEDVDKLVFKKTMKTFGDLASKSKDVIKGVRDISKAFGIAEDSVTDNVLGILETTMDSATSVIDTLASTATSATAGMAGASASAVAAVQAVETASVILAIIAAVMQVISAIVKVIMANTGDALKDKEIEKSEQQLKRLENAYSDLERVMDKALGDDKFKAHGKMLNNLGSQMTEISKQADLERSKKDSDGDKVDDLNRQYVELGYQIDDLLTSIKDDIIGSTAKDISQELGDAIFEAFANGTDAAEAWGAKVDEIIGDILKKMLISKFLEKPIADAVDKFYQMTMPANAKAQELADQLNNLNQEISEVEAGGRASSGRTKDQLVKERDRIADLLKKQNKTIENEVPNINKEAFDGLQNSLNGVGGNFQAIVDALPEDLKKYLFGDAEAGEGLKEGVKGVTEDTASLLASYMNAIRQHVATQGISLSSGERNLAIIAAAVQNMNWLMGDSRAMATQGILHLKNIEANTFNTAAEAKAIAESAVKTIKVAVEIAESNREIASYWKDVTTGTKKINVK